MGEIFDCMDHPHDPIEVLTVDTGVGLIIADANLSTSGTGPLLAISKLDPL